MAVFHTGDSGEVRDYQFRPIRSRKVSFCVKAERGVALCLSAHDDKDTPDMYEIYLGCFGGSHSGIRRGREDEFIQIETPDILSPDEFRHFWIKKSLGTIKVGIKGRVPPLVVFHDPSDHLQGIKYYGYSTGFGAEGEWMFGDEKGEGSSSSSSSSSSSAASSSDSEAEGLDLMDVRPIMYKRPARWVSAIGGHMPTHPVCGGKGHDGPVYVGMAMHEGGHILGMVRPDENICIIPFGGDAIPKDEYYVLGHPTKVELTWKAGSAGSVPTGALQGGHTEDGDPLYIGRVMVDGEVSCGKVQPSHKCCYVPYRGSEHSHRDYEVLCAKGIPCKIKL